MGEVIIRGLGPCFNLSPFGMSLRSVSFWLTGGHSHPDPDPDRLHHLRLRKLSLHLRPSALIRIRITSCKPEAHAPKAHAKGANKDIDIKYLAKCQPDSMGPRRCIILPDDDAIMVFPRIIWRNIFLRREEGAWLPASHLGR